MVAAVRPAQIGGDLTENEERGYDRAPDVRSFLFIGIYEIDIERVVEHARRNGCFFEINSSPDRLDVSADHARRAAAAGVMIAVNTDAHGTGELPLIRCGIDQARRAGLEKSAVLNCQPWEKIQSLFRR